LPEQKKNLSLSPAISDKKFEKRAWTIWKPSTNARHFGAVEKYSLVDIGSSFFAFRINCRLSVCANGKFRKTLRHIYLMP
jgi:hypothetical protein